MSDHINKVLDERAGRYGTFKDHAEICQKLQTVLWDTEGWDELPLDSRQALVVICDKMARMLNGDPDYDDNWVDIIGYATLVLNRIRDDERKAAQEKAKDELADISQNLWHPDCIRASSNLNDKPSTMGGTEDRAE